MSFKITYANASGVTAYFMRRNESDAAKLAPLLKQRGYRVAVKNEQGRLVDLQEVRTTP